MFCNGFLMVFNGFLMVSWSDSNGDNSICHIHFQGGYDERVGLETVFLCWPCLLEAPHGANKIRHINIPRRLWWESSICTFCQMVQPSDNYKSIMGSTRKPDWPFRKSEVSQTYRNYEFLMLPRFSVEIPRIWCWCKRAQRPADSKATFY